MSIFKRHCSSSASTNQLKSEFFVYDFKKTSKCIESSEYLEKSVNSMVYYCIQMKCSGEEARRKRHINHEMRLSLQLGSCSVVTEDISTQKSWWWKVDWVIRRFNQPEQETLLTFRKPCNRWKLSYATYKLSTNSVLDVFLVCWLLLLKLSFSKKCAPAIANLTKLFDLTKLSLIQQSYDQGYL